MSGGAATRLEMIPPILLSASGPGRKLSFRRGEVIFRQGDASDGVYLVTTGRVRLAVTTPAGRQATVALLGRNEVFGELCLLSGRNRRVMTALATTATDVAKIALDSIRALVSSDIQVASFLLKRVVARMAQYEQILVYQIINNTERRLARVLLQLSKCDSAESEPWVIKDVSQELLAEMVGASRPRVNGFMNKFRRLGYVDYRGNRIAIKPSLFSILLQDGPAPPE
jgi:CRP/FNR family transcriptional regulator, cyclic AMP receptor protein